MTPFEQGLSGDGKMSINHKDSLPYHLLHFLRQNFLEALSVANII
ncbi:hypothetical protein AVDCRST_MAG92-119 [uncultured Coleofasciculus sp.]|uniref:Uncharacterized protein n=1 Tax=uncultured Coleofasciculus sp. TaxID=1267456 RepID=A0A6J4H2X0_9CYAN|nr:hypothetical protein AVDCRST_MAG92-119 [uncultured Coleofasciculus sp.]